MRLTGDWEKALQIASGLAPRFQAAVQRAAAAEGQYLRGEIIKGIRSGAPGGKKFAPLSAVTLAIRKMRGIGGTKPLIQSGALLAGIAVIVKPKGGANVTVLLAVKRASKSHPNIGAVHEEGRTWTQRFSPKARRFLFAALRKAGMSSGGGGGKGAPGGGGDSMITITIRARPYVAPVLEKEGKMVAKRFWANVAKGMGGDLGTP